MRRHGEALNRIVVETCRADKRKNSRERTGNRKEKFRDALSWNSTVMRRKGIEQRGQGKELKSGGIDRKRDATDKRRNAWLRCSLELNC